MRVTVFGGTGSVGSRVVAALQSAGHDVTLLVRDRTTAGAGSQVDDARLRVLVGDLTDAAAIARAVQGSQAVIWAVGATRNTPEQPQIFEAGARHVVDAMHRHGVHRLVALSGAGVTVERERKPLGGRLISAFVRRIVPHVVEAKRREYEVFRQSGLEWTLVRPPRVVEGDETGRYRSGERLAGWRVTQGDLARFMVDQLDDGHYLGRAPYVSS